MTHSVNTGWSRAGLALKIISPERRDVPQPLNNRREVLDDVIHLLLGIIDGKAETDGTMGGGKRNSHSP